MADIEIIKIDPERWVEYKDLRLEGLKTEPQAFAMLYEDEVLKTDIEWRERLVSKNSANMKLFAEYNGKLVGMIGSFRHEDEPEVAEVINVYVKKDYRDQGIGKLLLKSLLEKLSEVEDVKIICLSVTSTQASALKTYTSCGFEIIETIAGAFERDGVKYDEIMMKMDNHKITDINYQIALNKDMNSIVELLEKEGGDRNELSAGQFIIAKDCDDLIGCVRIQELNLGTAELASLVVEKKYRGKGIGKRLVNEVMSFYPKRPVYLLCDSRNAPFYEKNSFSVIKENLLPDDIKELYDKILLLPFAKNMKVVAMVHY